MTPPSDRSASATAGKLSFHVIVDDFSRTYSIDGPNGPNGVRLHYEIQRIVRSGKRKLRDFDVRAETPEEALATMGQYYPGYTFAGNSTVLLHHSGRSIFQ
jgi:hypothetical protein